MRRKVEFILAVLFLAGLIVVSRNVERYVAPANMEGKKNLVILDAGHGGADPGKIGVNKAKEKDINLQIALKTKKLLEKENVDVVLTRKDDTTMEKTNSTNKKVEDMKARVALINKQAPALVVSIHQNSYQQSDVSGAQVFYYSHSEEGKTAAEIMQEALLKVDADNNRKAKANDTYYLLKRTKVPTIIVECGFLSNAKEAELLNTDEYQQKIAESICGGILEYIDKEKR